MIMPNPTLLPTVLRELFKTPDFERIPEPDLVMAESDQVEAYAEGGLNDSLSLLYLFNAVHCSKTISGARSVLDLGCGPGRQLCQIAALNPTTQFVGVDLSAEMLAHASALALERELANVRFELCDITALTAFKTGSFDAVISTLALHHLPNSLLLERCFAEISRVLSPDGAVYLADFNRLKARTSVDFISRRYQATEPEVLVRDFERSLLAAFDHSEFEALRAAHLPRAATTTMKYLPLLSLVATPPRAIAPQLRSFAQASRKALPKDFRGDLDDIRLMFKLAKLPGDPFC